MSAETGASRAFETYDERVADRFVRAEGDVVSPGPCARSRRARARRRKSSVRILAFPVRESSRHRGGPASTSSGSSMP
jgi:hypothetical protein